MRSLILMMGLAGLAACGGEPQGDTAGGTAAADATTAAVGDIAASEAEAPIEGTRAEVEQAWKCRGLMSAAFAARTVIKDDLPDALSGISSDTAMYWTDRAARLRAPGMTEQELDMLTASSVRVLATPQAIENALPDIRECLAAQGAG